jgi:hypothetical protein
MKKKESKKMIKFSGKPWAIKGFMQYLMYKFGAKATLKEVIEKGIK